MLLKSEKHLIKNLSTLLLFGCLYSSFSYAQGIDCTSTSNKKLVQVCTENFSELREKLSDQHLTAYLMSDAPIRLLEDTQQLWIQRLQQCKSLNCYTQQFDFRIDQLNFFTSMNQSMTQHYLKYENGQFAAQPVHLQIHQLNKNSIKIEGIAYRNPNNRLETQSIAFLAYTTPEQKNKIIDNEHDCSYDFEYSKAILKIQTKQKGCERFAGIYRLYD